MNIITWKPLCFWVESHRVAVLFLSFLSGYMNDPLIPSYQYQRIMSYNSIQKLIYIIPVGNYLNKYLVLAPLFTGFSPENGVRVCAASNTLFIPSRQFSKTTISKCFSASRPYFHLNYNIFLKFTFQSLKIGEKFSSKASIWSKKCSEILFSKTLNLVAVSF